MDRIDRSFAFEEAARQKQERQADVRAAGGLFTDKQQAELRTFLVEQCWLTPKKALEVIDDIAAVASDETSKPAGGMPVKPLDIITESLSGKVKDKFLGNKSNFTAVTALLTSAMDNLSKKLKAAPGGPAAPKPGA